MKRIIVFATMLIVVLSANVGAIDLGKKLALRLVNFPLNPAMDTGVYNAIKWPDSATIATWATSGADTGNTTSQVVYGTSTTTVTAAGLAALGIRADSVGTNTPMFVMCDTLRILNAGTTTRQLAGMVTLWKYGAPFTTHFSVTVEGDTAEAAKVLTDSVNAILDTLQLHDNWVAKEASVQIIRDTLALYDTRFDSLLAVVADANTLFKNRLLRIRDSVDVILDTLQNHDNWVATQANQTLIKDTVNGIIDTLQATDTRWDSTLANFADANTLMKNRFLRIRDSVDAILDTLQNTDNWIASAANLTKVIDTVNGIIDTLQVTDTRWDSTLAVFADANTLLKNRLLRVRDSVDATLDTLQNHDNWVASATNLTKAIDTVNAVIDTLQNASSTLRVATVDTAAVSKSVKERLFADTSKKIGFAGGAGDSVKAATSATVSGSVTLSAGEYTKIADSVGLDSAKFARSMWDNDVVPRANRTIDEVDTVVLACINGDTVANAGDFLKTALDYREAIKNIYGVATSNSTWMTDTVLNQLIRQAVVKVNPLMRGVKFKDTLITNWQQSDYNLDSMIGVIAVSWQREDTVRPIVYSPLETWGALTHQSTWSGDDPYLSRPSVYDVTDNQIMFFPPPTQTDTIEIVGFRKIYGIVTTSDFSAIPQSYRIPVLYYAAFLVAQSKQHPGTDRMLNEYNKAVSDVLMALNRRANVKADSK